MNPGRQASFGPAVLLLLAGPVVWFTHFMAVYVAAEALCRYAPAARVLGMSAAAAVTVVLTLPALAVTVWLTVRAARGRGGPHGELVFAGFLLGLLFALSILFVALPPLFLRAC